MNSAQSSGAPAKSAGAPSRPGLSYSQHAANGLPQALSWTAKRVAYSVLPPSVLCLLMYLVGLRRFCTDARLRHRLMRVAREIDKQGNQSAIIRISHDAVQRIASKHFTHKVLPQRMSIGDLVQIEGRHHLDTALAQGKGVIMASGHIGYPLMAEMILGRLNYRSQRITNYAADQERFFAEEDLSRWPWLDAISRRLLRYARLGEPILASLNLRPVFSLLERNGIVLIAVDASAASRWIVATVLGIPKPFGAGAFELARDRGVPMLPAFLVRDRMWAPRLRLVIHEPLRLQRSNDKEADLHANVAQFARILGSYVARYPHLYDHEPGMLDRIRATSLKDRYAGRSPLES